MTAVEKAIEILKNFHLPLSTNTKENRKIKGAYVHCIMILKQHLELEKQQIENAFNAGVNSEDFFYPPFEISESDYYYNETYKKDKS